MTALEIAVKALEEIHRGAFSPTGVATSALAAIAAQQIGVKQDDALALAIMEHLGPAALTGGKMTPLEAFERGYGAGLSASPNERLLEIIASCYAGLGATFDLPERFLDVLADPLSATQEQIDALLPVTDSENAAADLQMAQDTARYHHIRDHAGRRANAAFIMICNDSAGFSKTDKEILGWDGPTPEEFDAMIDAAIAAKSGQEAG